MALTINSSIGIFSNWRTFDGSWNFEYTTLTTNGHDAVEYPDEPIEEDKSKYPPGTLFFDSDVANFVMSSSVKNVFIDKVPIVVKSSNIQYTSLSTNHRCSIIFNSKTPVDPGNLRISLGASGEIIYEVNRKTNTITSSTHINNITLSRNAELYTLTFNIITDESSLTDDMLTENQLYVTVWNIAANTTTFNTTNKWKTIDSESDISDAIPLIITFTDPVPENRIIYPPNDGSIRVIVQNPNADLFDIEPTVKLEDDSIGIIDKTSYGYDYETGTLSFYVRPITETGYVVVSAWLAVDNSEISGALKTRTFATAMDGEWIGATEGRLIRFKQNVPKYLKNDNYASFVQSTEDFFNTVYTSLTNGKHISILEKFARINDFNDIKAMEAPLIDLYRKQYGIQVQPNNDDLNFYLRNKQLPDPELQNCAQNLTASEQGRNSTQDTDSEALKNYVFRDITGLELNAFIKDIYKNIPYYNQMSGTYRGIKFILNQVGLCVKLVEIWSSRDIIDNFDHTEIFAREDELNASRYNLSGQISDIGRYYLTSRFDVDVMETGLTFREFNELSYNIVKLILKVKPIHRVLRKLAYVHVTNTDMHFQHFLLDKLGGKQEVRRYKYTWNLFDKYAIKKVTDDNGKNHTWAIGDKLYVDRLFFPFNTVDAQYTHADDSYWERYNAYGEDRGSDDAPNQYAREFLNPHTYSDTPETKPYFNIDDTRVDENIDTLFDTGYATASKNSYNNLFNIEDKLKRTYCKQIGINFCYLEVVSKSDNSTPPALVCYGYDENNELQRYDIVTKLDLITSMNTIDLVINVPELETVVVDDVEEEITVYKPTKLVDLMLGKAPKNPAPEYNEDFNIPENAWLNRVFDLGNVAVIKSETNGFQFNLIGGAQAILSELGMGATFNEPYTDDEGLVHTPLALFAQIADFKIALGTDYLTYETSEKPYAPVIHYAERKYDTIENLQNYQPPVFELKWMNTGWGTCYYVLKKGHSADRLDPANWERVYTAKNGETHDSSLLTTLPSQIVHINSEVELDAEGYPIVIFAHYGTVKERYTREFKTGLIHYGIDEAQNETITFAFSDEDDQNNPEIFKVMDKAQDDKYAYIIYRISDLAQHADFSINNGDAEFALIVDKN